MKKAKQQFQWNKVTPLSKYLAMALFIALPFIGFLIGMRYQQELTVTSLPVTEILPPSESLPEETQFTIESPDISDLRWESYTNSKLGIKFNYPTNYATIKDEGARIILGRKLGYVFEVFRFDTDDSLTQWWQKVSTDPNDGYGQLYTLPRKTTFKNQPALYLKNNAPAEVPMDTYVIKYKSSIMLISFAVTGDEKVQVNANADPDSLKQFREHVKIFNTYDKVIIDKILNSIELL